MILQVSQRRPSKGLDTATARWLFFLENATPAGCSSTVVDPCAANGSCDPLSHVPAGIHVNGLARHIFGFENHRHGRPDFLWPPQPA